MRECGAGGAGGWQLAPPAGGCLLSGAPRRARPPPLFGCAGMCTMGAGDAGKQPGARGTAARAAPAGGWGGGRGSGGGRTSRDCASPTYTMVLTEGIHLRNSLRRGVGQGGLGCGYISWVVNGWADGRATGTGGEEGLAAAVATRQQPPTGLSRRRLARCFQPCLSATTACAVATRRKQRAATAMAAGQVLAGALT